MHDLKAICVFCGSSPGNDPSYLNLANEVGPAFQRAGVEWLVYGGGSTGLMGRIADSALAAGLQVYGVQPDFLDAREKSHKGLTKLIVVPSMHARKQLMAQRADGFITLPGGIGTLEEFCEIFTWAQLGLHRKPIGLLNLGGYYDPLIDYLNRMVEAGFQAPQYRNMILVDDNLDRLLATMKTYQGPEPYLSLTHEQI